MKRVVDSIFSVLVLLGTIPLTASAHPEHLDLDLFKHHEHQEIPVVSEVNVGLVLIPIAFAILLLASRQLVFKRGTR
jgi:hypothetical protein